MKENMEIGNTTFNHYKTSRATSRSRENKLLRFVRVFYAHISRCNLFDEEKSCKEHEVEDSSTLYETRRHRKIQVPLASVWNRTKISCNLQ